MLGMFTTVKIQRHRNLEREQPLQPDCGFGSPPWRLEPSLGLRLWPTWRENTATKADTGSPALLSQEDPCSISEADRSPTEGLQGTWLSQGPTRVSELVPED